MLFKLTVALASLLVGVSANDAVHLVNCGEFQSSSSAYSVVVYCADDSNCDFNPAPAKYCTMTDGGQLYTWENGGSCGFSTGVTFSWTMEAGAGTAPDFSPVGSATNGEEFTVYKDDYPLMYIDSFGNECQSVYYCEPLRGTNKPSLFLPFWEEPD